MSEKCNKYDSGSLNKMTRENHQLDRRKPVKKLIRRRVLELAEYSTFHALPSAVRSPHQYVKLVWLIFFTASCVACSYITYNSISKYFNYEVLVKFNMQRELRSEFPAVTFCNLNPVNYFKYNQSIETIKETFLKYLNEEERNKSTTTSQHICDKIMNTLVKTSLLYEDGLFNLNLRNYLYQIEDMLITCSFNGHTCSATDFRLTFSGIYGNCYTFNSGVSSNNSNISVNYSVRPGEANGLQLELFIGPSDNLPCWASTNGAFISVHNRSIYPLFYEDGLKAQTGKETNLVVQRAFLNKMSKPYGDCIQDVFSNQSFNSIYYQDMVNYFGIYMQKYCIIVCAADMLNISNVTDCLKPENMTVNELKSCLLNVTNFEPFYSSCLDFCPMECSLSTLDLAPNFADYPTQAYAESFKKKMQNFTDRFFNLDGSNQQQIMDVSYSKIKDSILSLNVYYDSLIYTQIDEVPSTTFGEVLASVGGQLGLFLGISLLSFLEIVEMFYEIFFIYIDNNKRSKKLTIDNQTEKVSRV